MVLTDYMLPNRTGAWLLDEASERGNLLLTASLRSDVFVLLHLAANDPERARSDLASVRIHQSPELREQLSRGALGEDVDALRQREAAVIDISLMIADVTPEDVPLGLSSK